MAAAIAALRSRRTPREPEIHPEQASRCMECHEGTSKTPGSPETPKLQVDRCDALHRCRQPGHVAALVPDASSNLQRPDCARVPGSEVLGDPVARRVGCRAPPRTSSPRSAQRSSARFRRWPSLDVAGRARTFGRTVAGAAADLGALVGAQAVYSARRSARMIRPAAWMSARWEKAWGKLPRCRPTWCRTPRRTGRAARRR